MTPPTLTVNDFQAVPPREATDCRGQHALFQIIARSEHHESLLGAMTTAAQVARHEGDPHLQDWLNGAILRVCDARRQFDAHMREPAVHPTFAGILGAWQGAR